MLDTLWPSQGDSMAPRGNGAASGLFGSYRTPDVSLHQYPSPPTTYTPNHSSGVSYYNSGRYSVSPMSNCPPLERLQPAAMGYPGKYFIFFYCFHKSNRVYWILQDIEYVLYEVNIDNV
ncbi:uncharacterized protein TNCT_235021 [Trichonephila clavata]|uniref:Uncharacterized protein n=1 Tax=Trichonephila clavata TaxID=2740835 RepID=A0A8X6HAC4_TRICU|nr:uncharacterized protein TNCT_235021 [Trichonephila clavata]